MVETLYAALQRSVALVDQQKPVQLIVILPFDEVRKFTAHEQKFLARMRHGIAIQRAQAREFLPQVAGVLVQHAVLAVHHLVVREWQDVVFAEGVHQRERELIVVVFAIDRIELNIGQHIVHPAHVPLKAKAQAARVHGVRHPGIGGGFLGDHHHAGIAAVHGGIEPFQEGRALQVFIAAVDIGHPLPRLAAEIMVQDGADRVAAQAVGVDPLQPVARAGHQDGARLAAPEIKQHRAPLRHVAAAGILMLIAGRAVKAAQADFIAREVRGHPVQDHADARLVQRVDQAHQPKRRAVARRGREKAAYLIAPAHIQRMLHDGQELHMRIAHVLQVGHQLGRRFLIGIEGAVLVPPPGAQVHFIDIDRLVHGIALGAAGHPVRVLPGIAADIGEQAGVGGAQLAAKGIGIGPQMPLAVRAENGIFIGPQLLLRIGIGAPLGLCIKQRGGQPQLPCAVILLLHGIILIAPGAELARHAHAQGVGRPHGKLPCLPVQRGLVRAHPAIGVVSFPLVKRRAPRAVRR